MEYGNEIAENFEHYREAFRRLMAGKTLAEIRASRNVLYKLRCFTRRQMDLIIDDLRVLENYKTAGSKCMSEEFERMRKAG